MHGSYSIRYFDAVCFIGNTILNCKLVILFTRCLSIKWSYNNLFINIINGQLVIDTDFVCQLIVFEKSFHCGLKAHAGSLQGCSTFLAFFCSTCLYMIFSQSSKKSYNCLNTKVEQSFFWS